MARGSWAIFAAAMPRADNRWAAAVRRVRLGQNFGSDMQGKELWHRDFEDYKNIDVCFASSPILYRDTVILLCDKNNKAARLTAYDVASGAIRWEKKRPTVVYGHTTPVIVNVGGKPQMLIAASNALQSINPDDGEMIWWVDTVGDVPTPVFHNGLVYTDSGRGSPGIREMCLVVSELLIEC